MVQGRRFFDIYPSYVALWIGLLVGLVACGFYSPWMVRHATEEIDEDFDEADELERAGTEEVELEEIVGGNELLK
jgi:hypothetical protein